MAKTLKLLLEKLFGSPCKFTIRLFISTFLILFIDNSSLNICSSVQLFLEMAEQHDVKATLGLARNIVNKLQDVIYPIEQVEQIPNIESMEIEDE